MDLAFLTLCHRQDELAGGCQNITKELAVVQDADR